MSKTLGAPPPQRAAGALRPRSFSAFGLPMNGKTAGFIPTVHRISRGKRRGARKRRPVYATFEVLPMILRIIPFSRFRTAYYNDYQNQHGVYTPCFCQRRKHGNRGHCWCPCRGGCCFPNRLQILFCLQANSNIFPFRSAFDSDDEFLYEKTP